MGIGGKSKGVEICNIINNKNIFLKICVYGNVGHGQTVCLFHSVDTVVSTDIRNGMR